MFVGETGVGRVIERTCEAMKAAGIEDPTDINKVRALGVIDLPTIQKKINFHYSVTLDLFGSEISTNAANAFNAGIKGRFHEDRIDDDHQLQGATYRVLQSVGGRFEWVDAPALSAINARLRDDYINDCQPVMRAWNRVVADAGIDFELTLPHRAFHRKVGDFSGLAVTPVGEIIDPAQWQRSASDWLPAATDLEYIASLMRPYHAVGAFAPWIAPPSSGVGGKPGDFEYVRLAS